MKKVTPSMSALALAVAISSEAFADISGIRLPIRDGQRIIGEASVVVADDFSDFKVHTEQLRLALEPLIIGDLYSAISQLSEEFIAKDSLSALGIDVSLDMARAELVVSLLADDTKPRKLRLSRRNTQSIVPADAIEPAPFSGFVNAQANLIHDFKKEPSSLDNSNIVLDGALYIEPLADMRLETSAEILADGTFVREYTTATFYPDENWIVRVGDVRTPGVGGFQSGQNILGVSATNESSYELKPQRNLTLDPITVETPSKLRVYLNGSVRRTYYLQPGVYELTDLPLSYGANDIAIEITAEDGSTELIELDAYLNSMLLPKGKHSISVAAGAYASQGEIQPEYSDEFLLSGQYAYGLTDKMTVGIGTTISSEGTIVGSASSKFSYDKSFVTSQIAVSNNDENEVGFAAEISLQSSLESVLPVYFNLSLGYKDSNFVDAPGGQGQGLDSAWAAANVSTRLDSGWSLNARYQHQSNYRNSNIIELSASKSFDNWSFRASAQTDLENDLGAKFSLTYRPDEQSGVGATFQTPDNISTINAWRRSEHRGLGSWNTHASARSNKNGDLGGSVSGRYQGSRAVVSGGVNSDRARVSLSTSFAFTDAGFAISRPINDGFVFIEPDSSLDDRIMKASAHQKNIQSQSDSFSDIVVLPINVKSSGASEVWFSLDESDGAELIESISLQPSQAIGYSVEVVATPQTPIFGTLINENGSAVALQQGQVFDLSGRELDSFFTDKNGRFGVRVPKEGTKIVVGGLSVKLEEFVASDHSINDVGTLILKAR